MRLLRVVIILSALFWLMLLVQHAFWLPHALQRRFSEDPQIGVFASRYVVTNSARLLLFVSAARALGFYVYRARRVWAAVALCILFALAIWQYFLAGLPLLFRPPFGDGSLSGAGRAYLQFHSTGLWLQVAKVVLAVSCCALWGFASYHMSGDRQREV